MRPNSITEKDFHTIRFHLDILLKIFPIPQFQLTPAQLERSTINKTIPPWKNERLNNIAQLIYPPSEAVKKYGRCNMPQYPMLYACFHYITAIQELRPEFGDFITHTEWKLKEEISIKVLPIFFITQVPGSRGHNSISSDIKELYDEYQSNFSNQDQRALDMAMEFLAKCFSKKVDKINHLDYYLSAYISSKVLSMDSINFEGILYPSVESKLSFSNMAFKPEVFDKRFVLTQIMYERNDVQPYMNGINSVLNRATNYDKTTGEIIWD